MHKAPSYSKSLSCSLPSVNETDNRKKNKSKNQENVIFWGTGENGAGGYEL